MRRFKTPVYLQMETSECGAAALGSILGYFGCYLPLEELRARCGISRDGSKLKNILKAARQYGLKANAYKIEPEELKKLETPALLYWNFNHFVVLECLTDSYAYINDPSSGPLKISLSEFDKSFTGIVALFETTPQFKKKGRPKSTFDVFKNQLTGLKTTLSFIILVSLFLIIPGIIIPGFSKIFIDNILIEELNSWIWPFIFGMFMILFLQVLLTYLQNKFLLKLQIKLMLTMGVQLLWHILHLPISFFYQRFSGDIGNRMEATGVVSNLLSSQLTSAIVGLFRMAFFAIILLLINWQLACIGIFFAGLNFLLLWKMNHSIQTVSRNLQQKMGLLSGISMNCLQMIETIKATANEQNFFERWAHRHAQIVNTTHKMSLYSQALDVIPQFLNGLSATFILIVGAFLIMNGDMTVGSLVAFQSLLLNFNSPLQTLLNVGNQLQTIQGDLFRIDDVFCYPEEYREERKRASTPLEGKLTLTNISFGYACLESPFIKSLSLTILPGQCIAFIGPTGCGKSTLARLMSSLYSPWKGQITLDDVPIREWSQETLEKNIAFVEQEILLFEGTVRDNLTLWKNDIEDERLLVALKQVDLLDMLIARGGLDCKIDEQGKNLSAGQRQRMEIARALVNQPKVLILDEATAYLDSPLEHHIFSELRQKGMTLIFITHRLSIIKDVDHVVVLEKGEVILQGTHETLKHNPAYRRLLGEDE